MQNGLNRKLILLIMGCLFAYTTDAQLSQDSIQKYTQEKNGWYSLLYPQQVAAFYKNYKNGYAWVNNSNRLQEMVLLLNNASELGLSLTYLSQSDFLPGILNKPVYQNDSLLADIYLTDVAIQFFHELLYGNTPPFLGYNGVDYTPDCFDIPQLLAKSLMSENIADLIKETEPRTGGYRSLKQRLFLFSRQVRDSSFSDSIVTGSGIAQNNTLIARLYQLGFISGTNRSITRAELQDKLKECQRMFNLKEDGQLNQLTREAMNVSLRFRIEELKTALNTVRWLRCLQKSSRMIIVNIPSAYLLVYDSNKISLQSRLVVGKRSTRTPVLTSNVNELILYPYWVVPKKIATRELLPSIKRNYQFIDDNNFQVLDLHGRVVDPKKINWRTLSAANFPYELRQSTGCDNSLGLIKFNFYSPYGVYLHDTPMKYLFNANKRYFSHGCIRVEKAMELARLLLNGKTEKMDSILEMGCLPNQKPVSIPLPKKTPVFVLYNTAWFDSDSMVQFNRDIYNKLDPAGRPKTDIQAQ